MNDSGKGVLYFLGICMGVTELALGLIAKTSESVKAEYIMVLCAISLFFVLTALVLMFFKNPQLLIAQSSDLIPLALLDKIQGWEDPRLVKLVLDQLVARRQDIGEEEEQVEPPIGEARKEFMDALQKLES